ncbi:MAG TPA: hypothetical protein VKX39_07440 [Bryobacteraceae bacterium]|nr:hypothetical protein [Bryobacteraceae bacterium]
MRGTARTPPRIGLIASVLAAVAALWTADMLLARSELWRCGFPLRALLLRRAS